MRKVALKADDASINITGQIADVSGPTGDLTVKAGALDVSQLLAFVSDFSKDAGFSTTGAATGPASTSAKASAMNLTVAIDAERATLGMLVLDKLSGHARITDAGVTLDPVGFGVFGGRYEGTLALTLGDMPEFRLKATLGGIDMAAATAFAGTPNVMTGRLSGTIDIAGRGLDANSVSKTARGTVQMDITNGLVKNLGLIQAVVLATSMRAGAFSQGTGPGMNHSRRSAERWPSRTARGRRTTFGSNQRI